MIYEYTRELLPEGAYDIDNPNRKDELGNQIHLAVEVNNAGLDTFQTVTCEEDLCYIEFSSELTPDSKVILDTIVANHKANT